MNRRTSQSFLIVLLILCTALSLSADVKPHLLFSDNMVLQQGMCVPVWGRADNGEKVTVEFRGQTVSTTAHNHSWIVYLDPITAGGPFTMKITGSNTIEFKNVMVGDVWLCGGQSNMQFTVQESKSGGEALDSAENDGLRLFTVPVKVSGTPQYTIDSSWKVSSRDAAKDFSAVGYYFGRYIKANTQTPIGLLECCCGATSAEAWMSRDMLLSDKRFSDLYLSPTYKPAWWPTVPMFFYNGMLNAVIPYAIKGVIWYQGESNCATAYLYRDLFPAMVKGWRDKWGEGDFPFLYVQLTAFDADKRGTDPGDSNWAELREAQTLALKKIPNSGMATIIDVGEPADIHPKDKKTVGNRLALIALKQVYGKNVQCYSPMFRSAERRGGRMIVRFENAYSGLKSPDAKLEGFALAGEDRKWAWADARIVSGDKVEVSSKAVAKPVAIRYGWADAPKLNLFNSAGIPATPFRSDNWPLLTQPKQ